MAADMMQKCVDDVKKHNGSVDENMVANMLKSYRLVMSKSDTRLVACGDVNELETVKKNFLIKKLGMKESGDNLDNLVAAVCEKMKSTNQKQRLTFYYLLAHAAGKQSVFQGSGQK